MSCSNPGVCNRRRGFFYPSATLPEVVLVDAMRSFRQLCPCRHLLSLNPSGGERRHSAPDQWEGVHYLLTSVSKNSLLPEESTGVRHQSARNAER